jgi:hypothetical protein
LDFSWKCTAIARNIRGGLLNWEFLDKTGHGKFLGDGYIIIPYEGREVVVP